MVISGHSVSYWVIGREYVRSLLVVEKVGQRKIERGQGGRCKSLNARLTNQGCAGERVK